MLNIIILAAMTIWSFSAAFGDFMQLSAFLRLVFFACGLVFGALFIAHFRNWKKASYEKRRA